MPTNPNATGLAVARRLVADRYPHARAAWLGGSVASGHATATSDLDITVLLSGPPAPFRHSEIVEGWPVEWFVQTEPSLLRFCADDRTRRRRPTTMRLVGSAVLLVDADGSGARLQHQLHAMDQQGPPPIPHAELENHRYAVTDLLEDFTGAPDSDERLIVAAALVWATAELHLAVNRRWSGSGKWLLRELTLLDNAQSTHHGPQLMDGLRKAAAGDIDSLRRSVLEILAAAGGPLFNGYHRSADDASSIKANVVIHVGAVDEPGVADLLAYAVGANGSRHEETLRSYREDPTISLLVATVDKEPVGVLGYRSTDTTITVLHIAIAPERRRTGVGSRLLGALHTEAHQLPVVAETDSDAVAFYAANNFTITSLGEKYPGVERFRVSLPAAAVTTAPDANPALPGWACEAVEVVDADPQWPFQGQSLRDTLQVLLAPWLTAAIEHIGSTAVPDLPAKPIIDLQAAVTDLDEADSMAAALGPHDWHYVAPNLDQRPWRRFFVKVAGGRRIAHLHVMTADTPRWDRQIAFRDALRADSATRADYAALKRALSQRHSDDREAYSAAKNSFIQAVLDPEAE